MSQKILLHKYFSLLCQIIFFCDGFMPKGTFATYIWRKPIVMIRWCEDMFCKRKFTGVNVEP
ncbi:hypothetical protein Hanom_Chr06g00484311 [Helianthus anomalus]